MARYTNVSIYHSKKLLRHLNEYENIGKSCEKTVL